MCRRVETNVSAVRAERRAGVYGSKRVMLPYSSNSPLDIVTVVIYLNGFFFIVRNPSPNTRTEIKR